LRNRHGARRASGPALPGLLFTAIGVGLAPPTASIAITSGVQGGDQGVAGASSQPACYRRPAG